MNEQGEMIRAERAGACELALLLGGRRLRYAVYAPSQPHSMSMGEAECADPGVQALEEAIYATPVLLEEYQRVRVVAHSRHYVLLPGDASDEQAARLARCAFEGDDGEPCVNPLPGDVKVAFLLPRGLQAFLDRTFSYPKVYHHLAVLCGHFQQSEDSGAAVARMYVNMRSGEMTVAVYRDGKLLCANDYSHNDIDEAAFYILTLWRAHGLDQLTDELRLTGDREACAALSPALREFVKFVMPPQVPADAMRLGREALQAPLELIQLILM